MIKEYILSISLIIVISLIFFYPVLNGLVPLPADHLSGIYYPWLDYKWSGFPTGVPVKNPIAADVVSFMYPMQTFAIEQMKKGELPLWNPLILTGTPLLANFQSAPLSLLNVAYLFSSNINAWTIQIILQPILAAIFMYLLLKHFRLSNLSSFFGGFFYAFSGFSMIWLEWNGHGMVAAFFPLIFLLSFKLFESEKLYIGILLAISLAAQIFSGYPQIIIYELTALVIGMLIKYKLEVLNFKKIVLLSVFLILGVGLAMVQILPGYELIKLSQRGVEKVQIEWSTLNMLSVIRFVAPDFFGNHTTYNYWGPADYTQSVAYSGIVVVFLACLGSITFFKNKYVCIALAWTLVSILIGFENPFSVAIHSSGLFASQASSAHRIFVLSNLGIAILAAFGLEYLNNKKIDLINVFRAGYIPGGILIVYWSVSIFIIFWIDVQSGGLANLESLRDHLIVGVRNLVLPIVLYVASLILMVFIRYHHRYSQKIIYILCAVAVLELFRFGWKFNPFTSREIFFPTTPIIEYLQKNTGTYRVNANDVIPINLLMNYGIPTIEGYDAVYPINYARYISALNYSDSNAILPGRYAIINNTESPLVDVAAVKYILTLKRKQNGSVSPEGKISDKFIKEKFSPVFEDRSVVILENKNALARARMFYDWDIIESKNKTLEYLINNYPIDKKIIISSGVDVLKHSSGDGTVDLSEYIDKHEIRVKTNVSGLLFIADSLYPGWKVFVDGRQENILLADGNFMAVPVSDGEHKLKFIYMPDSFVIGRNITYICAFALFSILSYSYIIKKVRK